MAVALVFAMKLRDSRIYVNDDLEEFMANIQPPITEENYSEILRCSERPSSESNDEITEYQEVRLHLACTTKTDLKKVKQFISAGVINILLSHSSFISISFRTISISAIVTVGPHYIKPLNTSKSISFDIFSIIKRISMQKQTIALLLLSSRVIMDV
jgi:hypothetical protein